MSENNNIYSLFEKARNSVMSPGDWEEQRRNFAYGNGTIENPNITKELIDKIADRLAEKVAGKSLIK